MTLPDHPNRIADERRGGPVDTVRSPWDGTPLGTVHRASAQDASDALEAAARAFAAFRDSDGEQRARILERVADELRERHEDFAQRIALEGGKPIRYARGEVDRGLATLALAAAEARRYPGDPEPLDLAPLSDREAFTLRVPRGPVVAISPFNFPLNLVLHKLGPAVACGTTTVLKPPPQCPLTSFELAACFERAGLPPGVLNVLHCEPAVAQSLVEDPRPAVLSFTGSDAVGWHLKGLAGRKQVLLELGGNAPCVLDAGVDLDAVLPAVSAGAWAHAGQVCIRVQRVLVHRDLHDAFLERFVADARATPFGDPLQEATVVGPLIEERHVRRVLDWVDEAVRAGARLHCGGEARGPVVLPTVLTGVPDGARVSCEEVFGPVTVVEPFDDFHAALERCNATRFGLQAGVFTPDPDHAAAAWRTLEYGGVILDDVPTFRVDNMPYGGSKDSGFGREGVAYAVDEFSERRLVVRRRPH